MSGLSADHLRADEWLSGILGRHVFQLFPEGAPSDIAARVAEHLPPGGPRFYYAKVPVERVDVARALSSCGFYTVDVNVTFAADFPRRVGAERSRSIVVRDAQPEDAEQVLDIASTAFRYSRFHLDPALGPAIANRIKREWAGNSLKGRRGLRVSVAVADNHVAGFLAVVAAERAGRQVRVIDLIAVSPRDQRRGVGTELVQRFIDRFGPDADALEVGTQIANVPSMQLYERCGFSIARSAYVMHKHVPDAQVAS